MTIYSLLVLIHIVAAVAGLGASFAMPVVMNYPKNSSQARFSLDVNKKIEAFAKYGSLTLLITGLIMGFIYPSLFKTGWYLVSLIIYLAVQVITAGIMPKKIAKMTDIIASHKEEDLPDSYKEINGSLRPYNMILHTSAVILIILMSLKPF
ncbi:DUF2269 family protein [Bacillus sp. SG-1]|uniref:DUF2269 family protein n=1 Tax=Bacillus sp. SG-1 TaxID=161544 RepID=UPI00015444FE|nr:DUF2269 family protein [Bacillus sp. SG-1]EDL65222.1 hypothetical protein BSG1_11611 [Bacillus sp. SG-1]